MKRIRPVAIIVVVLVIILLAVGIPMLLSPSRAGVPMKLPAGPVMAYRLDPDAEAPTRPAAPRLHDWVILQQTDAPLNETQIEHIRDLLDSATTYSEYAALCMQPELAFRFGAGEGATDVIISVICQRVQFRRGAQVEAVPLSEGGAKQLARMSQELFPDAPPPATAP